MFSSLISFGSLATWVQYPFVSLALMFDGIIFSIVSYSYNLFLLMAQLNMNSILSIADVLVNRLRALIMVFVIFRLAISLINYLIDPSKATNATAGGVALVKRIIITAVMLLAYNFVFAFLNDLSAIIIGFNNGYEFQVIKADSSDSGGLLTRLVFGTNSDGSIDSYGREIAAFTFQQFLRNQYSTKYDKVFDEIKALYGDFTKVTELSDEVGKAVVYEYPFLSATVGLFLIYSIVKMAIEIGVRMFKLLILQMVAPIAIISYIDPTTEQKVWKNYTKTYFSTFIDAFVRILGVFLSTAFISAIIASLDTFFGSMSGDTTGMQKMLITIMIIVAGYRFALALPKFIESLFGINLGGDSKGFGKFMSGLGGFAIGGLVGGASGLITGRTAGADFGGTAANMLSGAFNGASSGLKGKSIAEKIKGVSESNKKNSQRAFNFATYGVMGTAKHVAAEKLGVNKRYNDMAAKYEENNKILEEIETARTDAIKNEVVTASDGYAFKMGTDKESFATTYADHDLEYQTLMGKAKKYENIGKTNVYEAFIKKANERYNIVKNEGLTKYNDELDNKGAKSLGAKNAVNKYMRNAYQGKGQDVKGHDLNTASGISAAKSANKANIKNQKDQIV